MISQVQERRRRLNAAVAVAAVFLLLTAPIVLMGLGGPSEFSDQERYHQVAVDAMTPDWPRVDIRDYPSATSPGLHFVMAGVQHLVGPERGRAVARCLNLLIGLALLLTVHRFASRFVGGWPAAALVAPLMLSQYVLSGAIWLTTDNASLFLAMLALALAFPARPSAVRGVGAGVAAACAVGVRQVHLWAAAPIGLAALLASPLAALAPRWLSVYAPADRRWAFLVYGCIGAALPFALMAWFYSVWGGLMPPMYAEKHNAGPNLAAPAVAFALAGAYGVWFLPLVGAPRHALRHPLTLTLGVAGLLAGLLPATGFQPQERAFGALWRAVAVAPEVAGRSLLICALAALGGVTLALLHLGAARAGRSGLATALLLSLLGWTLAQTMNTMAWQRYFEPVILAFLVWLAALGAGDQPLRRRHPWWGVGALITLQALAAAASMYREVILYGDRPVQPVLGLEDGSASD